MSIPVSAGLCLTCKTPIWMEQSAYDTYVQTCASFYCIHGHQQCFVRGKSEAQKLRDGLERERRRRQSAEQNVEYESQMKRLAERSTRAYKDQATKLRNRAKAGICPCCQRHFTQLERHMATKHPGFQTSADAGLLPGEPPILDVVEGGKR